MSSSTKNLPVKGLRGRCLSVFPGDTVSHVGIFDPALWTGSTLPPFPVWRRILYTRSGVLVLRQINACLKVPLQVNFFRWRNFTVPSMSLFFYGVPPLPYRCVLCVTHSLVFLIMINPILHTPPYCPSCTRTVLVICATFFRLSLPGFPLWNVKSSF
jgi:hypothetical protein